MDCSWINPIGENIKQGLEKIPELVFCKDCIHWNDKTYSCKLHDNPYTGYRIFHPNDFCSKGINKGKE